MPDQMFLASGGPYKSPDLPITVNIPNAHEHSGSMSLLSSSSHGSYSELGKEKHQLATPRHASSPNEEARAQQKSSNFSIDCLIGGAGGGSGHGKTPAKSGHAPQDRTCPKRSQDEPLATGIGADIGNLAIGN